MLAPPESLRAYHIHIGLNQFHSQFFEFLIAFYTLAGLCDILLLYEHRRTAPSDAETELVIWAMFFRINSVFAFTTRCSAYVPLLADAARQDRPEAQKLLLYPLNTFLYFHVVVLLFTDSIYNAIGIKQEKKRPEDRFF
jgi:hypothetical protein